MRSSFIVAFIALVISFACFQGVDATGARLNRRHLNSVQKRNPGEPAPAANSVASGNTLFAPVTNANTLAAQVGTTMGTASGVVNQFTSPTSPGNVAVGGAGSMLGGATAAAAGLGSLGGLGAGGGGNAD